MVKKHNTKEKILKLLISSKKKEFTIRVISQEISEDYKSVYLIIQDLIKDQTVNAKKIGQTILCSINTKKFNADIFRTEVIRRIDKLKNKDIKVLYKRINEIENPFFILLIFGSYAKNPKKHSDIDLMLITDEELIKKKINHILSLLPLKIHLTDFSTKEYLSMLKTTEFNVGKEAFDNNIILFGIESYYGLIQNA